MRPVLTAIALALGTTSLAAGLNFSAYPSQSLAGQPIKIMLLIENPSSEAATYNTATCPVITLEKQSGRAEIPPGWTPVCTNGTANITILAGERMVQMLTLPTLPAGTYHASLTLNDAANDHQTAFSTFFSVQDIPQIMQGLDVNPLYLVGQPITLKVVTRNISSTTFSQDLRLCGVGFLIRDGLGKTVYESPRLQTCTSDLRTTTLEPGQTHTEDWWEKVNLPAGRYQVLHWSRLGSAMGSFEVK